MCQRSHSLTSERRVSTSQIVLTRNCMQNLRMSSQRFSAVDVNCPVDWDSNKAVKGTCCRQCCQKLILTCLITQDDCRQPVNESQTITLNRMRYWKSQQTVTEMHCSHSIPSYGRRFVQYSQQQNKRIITSVSLHMPPSEQDSIH